MPYKDRAKQKFETNRLNKARLRSRVDFVRSHKAGKPCVDCEAIAGRDWPVQSFDFDHRNPLTKRYKLSGGTIRHYSEAELLEEIAKCDLRCANCHRARTEALKHWGKT